MRARVFARVALFIGASVGFMALSGPPAGADFGGWASNSTQTGSTILGVRSSLRNGTSGINLGAANFALFRVVVQIDGPSSSVGLIQAGFGRATGLDACGARTVDTDYMEWAPVGPASTYTCYWLSSHPTTTQRVYATAKTSAQNVCTGCYTAFVQGVAVGPGEVSLASSYSSASAASGVGATGENYGDVTYIYTNVGAITGVGGNNWQWTSLLFSQNTWHNFLASTSNCQNTDLHWNLVKAFAQGGYVYRRVASGPSCP